MVAGLCLVEVATELTLLPSRQGTSHASPGLIFRLSAPRLHHSHRPLKAPDAGFGLAVRRCAHLPSEYPAVYAERLSVAATVATTDATTNGAESNPAQTNFVPDKGLTMCPE